MDPEARIEENEDIPVEAGWVWKRATLQQVKAAINIYYRDSIIRNIQDVLQHVGGDETLQQFRLGCFGHFLDYRGGISCNKALHALMTHEIITPIARDDEVWFHVGSKHIKFSKAEYALVTGLNFGESTFDLHEPHEMPIGVYNQALGGVPVSVFDLWKKFNGRHISGSALDYLKVANVLFLYLMLFGYDPERMIEGWVWVLVEDIARWNSFPWGAYTFQVLLHYIRKVPVHTSRLSKRKSYHFYGPVYALLIWAYEAIPELGRTCAVRDGVYPSPRCLMWTFPRLYKDFTSFFTQELDCFETLKPTVEELKQPYWKSLQCENPLGVRYTPRENPIKRVMSTLHLEASVVNQAIQQPMSCADTSDVDVLIQQPSRSKKRVLINEGMSIKDTERPTKVVKHPTETIKRPSEAAAIDALPLRSQRPLLNTTGSRMTDTGHQCCCKHVCIDPDAFEERVMGHLVPRLTRFFEDLVRRLFEEHRASSPQCHDSIHIPSRIYETTSGGLAEGSPTLPPSERVTVPAHSPRATTPMTVHDPISPLTTSPSGQQDDASFTTSSTSSPTATPESHHQPKLLEKVCTQNEDTTAMHKNEVIVQAYRQFRNQGTNVFVKLGFSGYIAGQDFFTELEDPARGMSIKAIDLYLEFLRRWLNSERCLLAGVTADSVCILDAGFFSALKCQWDILHPDDPECEGDYGLSDYSGWTPSNELVKYVRLWANEARPWWNASHLIIVCRINEHWVTCRVCLLDWCIELYDSLLYKSDDQRRDQQLRPLRRLLPELLNATQYWAKSGRPETYEELPIKRVSSDVQFLQTDEVSCGVYACMYAQRLITGTPPIELGIDALRDYRKQIAWRIYSLSNG
ncbi:hypothetical protein C2S51_015093 [Perilla frutescens var. frutescens]|nr:hypothetical protein C2S51_015093 [Perilla frutescens var. frutescens]